MNLPIGILVARKNLIFKFLEKDFAAKTSVKLKLLSKEVSKYNDVYEEERVKLVKKYGVDSDGKITVEENSENWSVFVKELTDVANQKVDVNFPVLTEDELIADDTIKISARELLDMEVFYEQTETPEVIPEVVAE